MHAAQVPGANGITNAPSLARMYAATIGEVDGVNGKVRLISEAMMQRASSTVTPREERDHCLMLKTRFAMGYMTNSETSAYSDAGTFGHPGAGGSVSFADPTREMAFSYVMNRMGNALLGDDRARNLVAAASHCADAF